MIALVCGALVVSFVVGSVVTALVILECVKEEVDDKDREIDWLRIELADLHTARIKPRPIQSRPFDFERDRAR